MPEQLKIIIDADVTKAVSGVQSISKVISGDFVKATEDANSAISSVKKNIESLSGKQLSVGVNTAEAVQKIQLLEKELADLQNLSAAPNVSSTQLSVFEANIKRIKSELAALKTEGVVIPISANTTSAQRNVNLLSETIETLRAKAEARKSFILVETDITKIVAFNKEIQQLEARIKHLQNVGKQGFELFVVPNQAIQSVKTLKDSVASFGGGVKSFVTPAISTFNKLPGSIAPAITQLKALEKQSVASGAAAAGAFSKAFTGLRSLAALIPGIGLGGLIGIAATAVNSLTQGFFDAAFGASKLDKAIDDAAGSIDKNSASVITMVKALQSGTLSSAEFRKVKADLIAQAPEFQKSFEGDKISIEASDKALKQYIEKLTTTIRVTAALGIVNDLLAESLKTIAKGESTSFGSQITSFFQGFLDPMKGLEIEAEKSAKGVQKAFDSLKPENISKLLEDTFKKLGITFKDFASTVDDKALEAALEKQKAAFDKFVNETIAKARQFSKEFGQSFALPTLEESFFKNKQQVFKESLKLLSDVRSFVEGNSKALQIKIPVVFESSQVKENVTKDINELNKVIQSLGGAKVSIDVTTKGIDEVQKQLSEIKDKTITVTLKQLGEISLAELKDKEISIKISQEGDTKKLAEQLTKLKGVEIPIVVEQKGNIEKIAEELNKLRGKTIPIKITEQGDLQEIITKINGLKDVQVQVSAVQNIDSALKEIEDKLKDKAFPIIIDQDGIIFQITKAIDGAISVIKIQDIKVPIVTEADIKILEGLTKEVTASQDLIDKFFQSVEKERDVKVNIVPDLSLSKKAIDDIDKKLNLKDRFRIFGDIGLKAFEKIDFSNITEGLKEATKSLNQMMEVATTLQQAIGQGLTNAFSSVFDAVLEGKSVFKALGNAIKDLIVQTIKAIAQMLILRLVTKLIFPGIGAAASSINIGSFGSFGGQANFGLGGQIANRAFNNSFQITGTSRIDGQDLVIAFSRATGSNGR